MPSRWWLPVDGVRPERVRLEHLHAAVSRWFDETAAEHSAATKPYAISPLAGDPGGGLGFELSTLTTAAEERLREAAAPPATIRLGPDRAALGPLGRIAHESWASLAEPSGARAWELEFVTPATFRRGNRSSPLPVAASVLRGLLDSWNACSGLPPRELGRRESDGVWVSDIDGRSEAMALSGLRVSGFVGRVRFRCDDPAVRDLVDPLFRLAPYSGVGSARAKGLGVTRLRADAPAGRRSAAG